MIGDVFLFVTYKIMLIIDAKIKLNKKLKIISKEGPSLKVF